MSTINWRRVVLGGLAAGLALLVIETVMEHLVFRIIPGVGSEFVRLDSLNLSRQSWTFGNHLFQLLLPFAAGMLLVFLYAAIRPRFGAGPKTAILAALIVVSYWLILLAYFVNVGLFPVQLGVASLVDNLIVLPVAALAGAAVYKERVDDPGSS